MAKPGRRPMKVSRSEHILFASPALPNGFSARDISTAALAYG
jgi:hypothetical protein